MTVSRATTYFGWSLKRNATFRPASTGLNHALVVIKSFRSRSKRRIPVESKFILLKWTTSLDSSSGTLICPSLCPRHVGRNNYVPLFGVDPIEWRLTRYYVIRDVIVIFEC